jgi:hypothetical protein
MSANSAATAGPTAPVTVAASAAAVAPFGPGNWPATATLTNLTQRERDLYASKLACMFDLNSIRKKPANRKTVLNVVETINLSLPNYVGPGNLGSNGGVRAGRAGQVLQVYNAQYAMTLNRHPFSHVHSFGSTISHYKGQMLELINRNSGLGMAAPGPVVAGQQQHLSLVAPPPVSSPSFRFSFPVLSSSDSDD